MTLMRRHFFKFEMMKFLSVLMLFLGCFLSAQKVLTFDSLKLTEVKDFFADDYGNIYLYKNTDLSFTKYDSLGIEQGRMMLTLPFKVQNVQNTLNIVLFSENAQEIKFADPNLNEIQKIDLRKFGFIKMAFTEDLQQVWLLDDSEKRLVQYNFRNDKIINSYPLSISFDGIRDMLVFEGKLYLLYGNALEIYSLKSEKMFEYKIEDARKLRRENTNIFIITKNQVSVLKENKRLVAFSVQNSEIVDKNSKAYFELKAGKLYLYKPENKPQK